MKVELCVILTRDGDVDYSARIEIGGKLSDTISVSYAKSIIALFGLRETDNMRSVIHGKPYEDTIYL